MMYGSASPGIFRRFVHLEPTFEEFEGSVRRSHIFFRCLARLARDRHEATAQTRTPRVALDKVGVRVWAFRASDINRTYIDQDVSVFSEVISMSPC